MPQIHVVPLAAILFIASQTAAYAYIDPGSGSIITSAIIGFFAAIAYTFRKSYYRIRDKFFGAPAKGDRDKGDF
ncbi:hypothetical protein [Shinella sumterensis]|uniref:hypothetical protein n=1 Tax=Shinella sumterensis TaxID=1967501 RepID=UPI003F857CBD